MLACRAGTGHAHYDADALSDAGPGSRSHARADPASPQEGRWPVSADLRPVDILPVDLPVDPAAVFEVVLVVDGAIPVP